MSGSPATAPAQMTLLTSSPQSQQPTSRANFDQALTKLPSILLPRQQATYLSSLQKSQLPVKQALNTVFARYLAITVPYTPLSQLLIFD